MNHQNMLCLGDSQTFGARSYGRYPLHLGRILRVRTLYRWRVINRATNGHTARDLWFRLGYELDGIGDTFHACLLIGTNDVGEATPIDLFGEYYCQCLEALFIKGCRSVFCGEIPSIHADGHGFSSRERAASRHAYNDVCRTLVAGFPDAHWVEMGEIPRSCYEDPVQLNEAGNQWVTERFADAVIAR